MTREETQTENGLWEKKRTQRGLYNCMFCLERRVCTSVNHHQGASAEQMAEEGIEPLIDFASVEGRKTETTESDTVLHVGKLLSCARTASTRRGSLDMEDMRRQDVNQCKGLLFFYPTPTQAGDHSHTPSSNTLPKILHKLLRWKCLGNVGRCRGKTKAHGSSPPLCLLSSTVIVIANGHGSTGLTEGHCYETERGLFASQDSFTYVVFNDPFIMSVLT
ncbi:hypothetical protein KUCAC02_023768 [Chaenocephalus aceratus]|uniref:Uncharacterized protein n=1 Tax=Chaenocephalus aceratus TaxID=36190 RepID=A0ACB9WHD6_CHAAC|nr:hypothetical protein KUCAC02_023768 [Chaenocephalus aceratus]